MHLLLAFDTSTRFSLVSITDLTTNKIYSRCQVISHSENLLPLIQEVLQQAHKGEASTKPWQAGAIICGIGPGSFTGLRVGLATAKGLCFAWQVPLLTFSSLSLFGQISAGNTALACNYASQGKIYARLFGQDELTTALLKQTPALNQDHLWQAQELIEKISPLGNNVMIRGDAPQKFPDLLYPQRVWIKEPSTHMLSQLALMQWQNRNFANLHQTIPHYLDVSAAERVIL